MNDDELKRTITTDDIIEETASSEAVEFTREIISDSEDSTDVSVLIEKLVHKRSLLMTFFAEHTALAVASVIGAFALSAVFFFVGSSSAKNPRLIEEKYAKLRESGTKYNNLIQDTEALNAEIDSLTKDRDRINGEVEALKAYDSKSPEIESKINDLQTELDTLNASNAELKSEIDSLTGSISEKLASIVNLPSGIYTVGDTIAAGKYIATGSGKILVSDSRGGVKLNSILTADGTEITLDDNDQIQLDTYAKFTPTRGEQGGGEQ